MSKTSAAKASDTHYTFIGIDPGKKGGIAVLDRKGIAVKAITMPQTEKDIWEFISYLSCHETESQNTRAVIERVGPAPGEGVRSVFTFGSGYGGLRMALTAAGIPFNDVTPHTWQRGLHFSPRKSGQSRGDWKRSLRAKAQQWFPNQKVTLCTADALLIAEYCRRLHLGGLTMRQHTIWR